MTDVEDNIEKDGHDKSAANMIENPTDEELKESLKKAKFSKASEMAADALGEDSDKK